MVVFEKKTPAPDLINAATLFRVRVAAGVEHDSVAGFQSRLRFDLDEIFSHSRDHARERPPLFSKSRGDEFLMIDAVHPAGEQAARESHLEFVAVGIADRFRLFLQCRVDRLAIDLRDGGYVFGRFQAALDFKTDDAEFDQGGDFIHCREVLR